MDFAKVLVIPSTARDRIESPVYFKRWYVLGTKEKSLAAQRQGFHKLFWVRSAYAPNLYCAGPTFLIPAIFLPVVKNQI
jgi:hypothetical protein